MRKEKSRRAPEWSERYRDHGETYECRKIVMEVLKEGESQ
jgi:hypothetical protein